MTETKSKYQTMLEGIIAKSTTFRLTDEENLDVLKDLSKGMEEFLYEEKQIETKSEMELTDLVLNG